MAAMFVVVCEDHQDVLPWLHAAMRRGVLPLEGWSMVHADAHPDLGAVTDASVCERPRALYDWLDESEFGISEWLLPLAYRGHLAGLTWLRSPFSSQFEDGRYEVNVGAEPSSGRLCVDCDAPYFVEDEAYSAEALAGARRLDLTVASDPDAACAAAPPRPGPWVLDICLDYFSCRDPFASDPDSTLARRCGPLPFGGAETAADALAAVGALEAALRATADRPPRLVTVARSAEDGYCPPALADGLEAAVVEALGRVYGALVVERDPEGVEAFKPDRVARAFPRAKKRPRAKLG